MPSKHASRTEEPGGLGTLYVVATPIGNLADISLRALDTLRSVALIAAEDTRHTRKLLSYYDIHVPLKSYHSHNQQHRGTELLERIDAGQSIALVTDAGTPGISDPGTLLIQEALERDVPVVVIPGPAALIVALVASGLPSHPFAFLGFAPARGSGRSRFFADYAALPMTVILYESPQRLHRTLEDILEAWGDRQMAVARELTKMHEEVFRGTVSKAREHFSPGVRGELTLVVSGAQAAAANDDEEGIWRESLHRLIREEGKSVREATEEILRSHRLPRRQVYQEALRVKESA